MMISRCARYDFRLFSFSLFVRCRKCIGVFCLFVSFISLYFTLLFCLNVTLRNCSLSTKLICILFCLFLSSIRSLSSLNKYIQWVWFEYSIVYKMHLISWFEIENFTHFTLYTHSYSGSLSIFFSPVSLNQHEVRKKNRTKIYTHARTHLKRNEHIRRVAQYSDSVRYDTIRFGFFYLSFFLSICSF